MNRFFLKIILLSILGAGVIYLTPVLEKQSVKPQSRQQLDGLTDLSVLQNAYENQRSNFQVRQTGQIVKLLKDDDHGSRHQRFVVALASGQKILIAHNIGLAPRVEDLQTGAQISFYGEYEWNNKGGIIHWTHHDPKGLHPGGWLYYNNRKYE